MAEKEGYEGKQMKLLPLNTGPRFSWMNWKAYLFIFAATIVLGKEVLLTNFSIVVETAAQKTARINCKVCCGQCSNSICYLSISDGL